jgi:hypothetical protein
LSAGKHQSSDTAFAHTGKICKFDIVKRVFSFLIIIQLLSNYEALAEMTKLPFLFHHYYETEHEHNFFDFLDEHYGDFDHDHHGSNAEHGKLPFKHSDDGTSHHMEISTSPFSVADCQQSIEAPEFKIRRSFILSESFFPSYTASIWQPPKLD